MRLTFVGFLLFASTALGQTVTFTGTTISDNEIVVSRENCNLERSVTWTRSGSSCDKITIWLSNDTCSGEPGTDDLTLREISTSESITTGTVTFTANQALARGNLTCEGQTEEKTFKLCATTKKFDSLGTTCQGSFSSVGTPAITFRYDPKPPSAPTPPAVTGLDAALSVTVTAPSDAEQMVVRVFSVGEAAPDGGAAPETEAAAKTQTSDNTDFRMEGLTNGVTYSVRAYAVDKAGNESPASEPVPGTPVASLGLGDAYAAAGGKETGGCGAAGGGLAGSAVLAALGFWLTSRRKQS